MQIAIYMRLSMADGDLGKDNKDESNSIENQRLLLHSYIENNDFFQGDIIEYLDDGYTGMNFERPGFKKMIEDAKQGIIQVIIVKDFSRFGRDYIGVGDYLEQIFPVLGIRFISLNNTYDSDEYQGKTMGLDMAISNLVNNLYSRDISVKLKSSFRTIWKQGRSTGAKAPFGYWQDKEKNWHIDEEAGGYVRLIFDKALDGWNTRRISDHMNELMLPTPAQYCYQKYGRKYSNTRVIEKEQIWDSGKIRTILSRREYTGALVMGKRQSVIVGSNISKKSQEHELYITENHHEGIVSQEEYEIAQDVIRFVSKPEFKVKCRYALRGKLRCGNCRLALMRSEGSARGVYYCYHKHNAGKYSDCCHDLYPVSILEATIMYSIRCMYKTMKRIDMEIEDGKLRKQADNHSLKSIKRQTEGYRAERIKQYELYADGTISKEIYIEKKDMLTECIEKLQGQIDSIEASANEVDEMQEFFHENWTKMEKMMAGDELTEELVDAFISNVYVYDLKHIEVEFVFEDVFEKMLEKYNGKGA